METARRFSVIPQELRDLRQWVLFKILPADKGKSKKIPFQPNGKAANINDPSTWCRFTEAVEVVGKFSGIGFVFSRGDPYCGVDLDNVVVKGDIKPAVQKFLQSELYSYTEYSPSRTGLHVIIKGQLPGDGKRGPLPKSFRCPDGKIEIYDQGRYFTMTGEHIEIFPVIPQDRQTVATNIWHMLATKTPKTLDSTPYKGTHADKEDDDIIQAFKDSSSKYSRIWDGDYSDYTSASEADLALLDRLIDLIGNQPERVKKIAFRSGAARDKWHREQYWQDTYQRANNRDRSKLLAYDNPDHAAKLFMQSLQTPIVRFWREGFYRYSYGAYEQLGEKTLKNIVWRWLATMKAWDPKAKSETQFKVSDTRTMQVFKGIRANAEVECEMPGWGYLPEIAPTEGRPDPEDLVTVKNGILQLSTGDLLPFTEDYFSMFPSPVKYDLEDRAAPQWTAFLKSLWPEDPESIDALQRVFGYLLSNSIDEHKIVMLIGPTRAGKGVISHVIENILGKANTCSLSASHLSDRFGMQVMIDKKVAIMPDVRIDKYSQTKIVEKLLNISGGDSQSIDRKYLGAWEGILPTRFLMISNELPSMRDSSGALSNRFVIIRLTESFLGREDRRLSRKLQQENVAIFNWAYEGYKKWRDDGLIEPKSASEMKQDLHDLTSPLSVFERECLILDPTASVPKKDVYRVYKQWATIAGVYILSEPMFHKDVRAKYPNISTPRLRIGGKRVWAYQGLDLQKEWV